MDGVAIGFLFGFLACTILVKGLISWQERDDEDEGEEE